MLLIKVIKSRFFLIQKFDKGIKNNNNANSRKDQSEDPAAPLSLYCDGFF